LRQDWFAGAEHRNNAATMPPDAIVLAIAIG
jgi:hypothetical protein